MDETDAREIGEYGGEGKQRERHKGGTKPAHGKLFGIGGRERQVADVVAAVLGGVEEGAADESQVEPQAQESRGL